MTPLIAALVLVSAALHPVWNALIKRAASPPGAYLGLCATLVVAGLLQAVILGVPVMPPPEAWGLLIGSAVGQSVYGVALVVVLQRGDLSAYYPVVRAVPVAIVAWGWLAEGRSYGVAMVAGILLVLAGGWWSQAAPGRRIGDPVALAAAVLAMLGAAVYSVTDGLAVGYVQPEVLTFWTQLGTLPLVFVGYRAIGIRLPLALPRRMPWAAMLAGLLCYASYYLILLAFQLGGSVAAVISVRQASIPLSVLAGALWLGERQFGRRFAGSLLVTAGIVLIVLNR